MSGTPAPLFPHEDRLAALARPASLSRHLETIHRALKAEFSLVDRIAVASYDPATDLVKTWIDSSGEDRPLFHYEARLAEAESLSRILKERRPRVVNDLSVFDEGPREHTAAIRDQGYASSYTHAVVADDSLLGFVFFNSYSRDAFVGHRLDTLDLVAHLISALVSRELLASRTLLAAVRTAHDMVHQRDPETGGHIDRMARFARLIARRLALDHKASLSDQDIERIFQFAPLHDIGKIAIPDRILLKPGALTADERDVMKSHTEKGLLMINAIARHFSLERFPGLDVLRHIAELHHEAMDGSGYPLGIRGEAIPLEARIVAVADVFDALTSARPYKEAWSNEEAFAQLRELALTTLDRDCVEALYLERGMVAEIQKCFCDLDCESVACDCGKGQ